MPGPIPKKCPTMHPTLDSLVAQAPVITDGAWGTQLADHTEAGKPADLLNLTKPDIVEGVARAYAEAGSNIVLSNTFNANRLRLKHFGLATQTVEINRRGAELSKKGAGDHAKVFASIGPSGAMLMMEDTTEEELEEIFTEQAQALADGGADGLVIETLADLQECLCAIRGAKKTGLPVVACLIYDSGTDKDHTMMGNKASDAASALDDAGADVIGANCGLGIEDYVNVCQQLSANTSKPVWIKANAGLPEVVDGTTLYRMNPASFAAFLPRLTEAGAKFIGGCCGTTPDFIRAVAEAKA